MVQMNIGQLVKPWLHTLPQEVSTLEVTNLVLDSRKVVSGDVFIAVPGHAVDGRKFINKAIDNGAAAVIAHSSTDFPHGKIDIQDQTTIIYLDDLAENLSQLAARRYPLDGMSVIAVTGTNGKTTITQIIAQWLDLIGTKAAVMGTTGNGFLDNLQPAVNTTGSAIEIFQTMQGLERSGAEITALETSSHGLVQGRVKALSFAAGLFTNLSRDHLDYHGTMEEYAKAKFSLFSEHDCGIKVINADDEVGEQWLNKLPQAIAVSTQVESTQTEPKHPNALWAKDVTYSEKGISLTFDSKLGDVQFDESVWGEGHLDIPLIGEFNANNVLLAFATLLAIGYDKQALIEAAPKLKPVIGRMELFQTGSKAKVVVDYAHTPDALEKALKALRIHCSGKLWAIFGCGGDRDKGKRPMMAAIAEKFADKIVMSDDNPRSEDPAQIIEDMKQGLADPAKADIEHNRHKALQFALDNASAQDIILLAGKGHEDYQIFKDETVYSSDRDSAVKLLGLSVTKEGV